MIDVIINIDGASSGNPGSAAIGAVIIDRQTNCQEEISQYIGIGTNNFAEYTALIVALRKALTLGARRIQIKSDSELLVKQIIGEYKVKSENLKELNSTAAGLLKKFSYFEIQHIRRELNKEADSLAKKAIIDYKRANRMAAVPHNEA